jgi:hypothetical protein
VGSLSIGAIYRYSSANPVEVPIIDDLPNYLFHTNSPGENKALLESGINPIGAVKARSGNRTPAILIASSTHKQGSKDTPWHDEFDVDNGYIKYFGDNKKISDPGISPGNRIILEQFALHHAPDEQSRLQAVPFLFFRSVKVGGRTKGNRLFQGVGLIRTAELVTQFQKDIGYFTNYVFEFDVLDLKNDFEIFSWEWISARRNADLTPAQCLEFAPTAWTEWVKKGDISRDRIIRRVQRFSRVKKIDQLPTPGTRESKCLEDIFKYYDGKKHRFELLAAKVVANIVRQSGCTYRDGWLTQSGGDGGMDFVGRIDLGFGFAKVEVIVLGQAKCQSYSKPTSGVDLARTIARLKRGWIGAYVTTSFFSEPSQIEIFEDQYPLITVDGLELAIETIKLTELNGYNSVKEFLITLDESYPTSIEKRKPEEILGL